jgi:hypothetical protein
MGKTGVSYDINGAPPSYLVDTREGFPPHKNYLDSAGASVTPLTKFTINGDTIYMDSGEIIFISSGLFLGAVAAFFAIMLWSKTRDIAWMLIVIGTIAAYINTVYSILNEFGIIGTSIMMIGSRTLASIMLPNLSSVFFIAAFLIMVIRKYRH